MSPTKIIVCTCEHKDQDKIYGKSKRLANLAPGHERDKKDYRCTVCGALSKFEMNQLNHTKRSRKV